MMLISHPDVNQTPGFCVLPAGWAATNLKRRRAAPGFTLLHLVVLLAIVAGLALVVIESTSRSIIQPRANANRQLLEDIRLSVAGSGDVGANDAARRVACFVTDMGRLPRLNSCFLSPGSVSVDELVYPQGVTNFPYGRYVPNATNVLPIALVDTNSAGNDNAGVPLSVNFGTNVYLQCGWRGPYLSQSTMPMVTDSWGKGLVVPQGGSSPSILFYRHVTNAGVPLDQFVTDSSLGVHVAGIGVAGGASAGSSVTTSTDPHLAIQDMYVSPADVYSFVRVRVFVRSASKPKNSWRIVLRFIEPNPDYWEGSTNQFYLRARSISAPWTNDVIEFVTGSLMTIGPKVAIAEVVNPGGNRPPGQNKQIAYPTLVYLLPRERVFGDTYLDYEE